MKTSWKQLYSKAWDEFYENLSESDKAAVMSAPNGATSRDLAFLAVRKADAQWSELERKDKSRTETAPCTTNA